jgi:hypothetical protein
LCKLEWNKWQESQSTTFSETFNLVIEAVANLRNLREIHIPSVFHNKLGALRSLGQRFDVISVKTGINQGIIPEWLEKQQAHLRELHIVRLLTTDLEIVVNNDIGHLE